MLPARRALGGSAALRAIRSSATVNPSALLCVPATLGSGRGRAENSRGAEPVTSTRKAASMSAPPMPRPERLELLRTNPLIEITLLHRAMRLELEAMCEATRALAAAPANDGAALAALRRRFRAFDAVFASHSAAEDDVVFPALAACAGRDVASHAAAEHIDEVALVDAAARGRCDGATVAALQDLKEKLADHMDHEEGEIFPLPAEIPERELKRMAGLVLGARPADVLELTIRLQVQHLEPALARHVLGTMCEVARGTRFRRWLDRALGAAAGAPAAAPAA